MTPDYLSYKQAAALLGVSVVTIKRRAADRAFPVVRLGRRTTRITREALEEFAARATTPAKI